MLLYVYPTLIKRCKTHFLTVQGLSVILGNNGLIWIHRSSGEEEMGGFTKNVNMVSLYHCLVRIRVSCFFAGGPWF